MADPTDPESPQLWEAFNYELACAELCGYGHYSMKRIVKIVSQEEYDQWKAEQVSWYEQSVKGKDDDPYKAKSEAEMREMELKKQKESFMKSFSDATAGGSIRLDNVKFETGSANLTADSRYELDNLIEVLTTTYPNMRVELAGHTDNIGNPASNLTLSQNRAISVMNYLKENGSITANRMIAKGYGDTQPAADNATEDGRKQNRRTECKIISNN